MVKTLHDLCLTYIQHHLVDLPGLHHALPTVIKELLLQRLAFHDLLAPMTLPYVTHHLFCPELARVHFYKCEQVTDALLQMLSESGCRLEVLTIHACRNVTDAGILSVTSGQTQLRILELRKLPALTAKGVVAIQSSLLWKLDLRSCNAMTTEGITEIVKKNPSIKVVNLVDNTRVDDKILASLAVHLGPSLEELYTEIHIPTDSGLCSLAQHCPNLRKLDLNGSMKIGKEALIKLFQECTRLEGLDLSYCNKLREWPDSEALWTLPQSLTELSLCGLLLDDETIFVECLQRLKCLRSIRLCGVSALNDNTLTKILEQIGEQLVQLDISGGLKRTLTDEGLKAVAKHCINLESLYLSLLMSVTGATLVLMFQNFQRAERLKKLYLSCREMNADILYPIPKFCCNLEELDLSGLTCVTDDLVISLAHNCPLLVRFSIKGCRQVTDAAVCELARCCPLRSFVLSGINNLTDKSVFALANSCHYLEEVYFNGCSQISPAAVRYLIDCCIPRLYVQHVTPNAIPNQLMAKNLDTGEFCRADLLWTK